VFDVIGFFDVADLTIGRDPLVELPMETYRPAEGLLVRDVAGTELTRPVRLAQDNTPFGFLTSPPLLLTGHEVARALLGDRCISAIRVRVRGSETMDAETVARIERVAKEIQVRTGLRVDVTIGSSPTRREVFVAGLPPSGDKPGVDPLGYVELPFVKKNVHITIVRELNRANLVVLGAVLLVAVFYTLTHSVVGVYRRLRQLALCRALGWRPGQVLWEIVSASLLVGGVAALCGMGLSFLLADWGQMSIPYDRVLLIGAIAVAIYALGSFVPGLGAGRTSPLLAMRMQETGGRHPWNPHRTERHNRGRVRAGASVFGLMLGAALARWRRHLLTLACLTVSTALLAVFLVVTLRMKGVMCGTLLGDFLVLQVTPRHLLTALLCLGLAAVAVAELVGLNVAERRGELELLFALGWRPGRLRWMIAAEGALVGLLGGLFGAGLTLWGMVRLYGIDPLGPLPLVLATVAVPVLTGWLGALIPALAVSRFPRRAAAP